ncbi:MAG: hypothetical protein RL065_1340 [Bacteroidota bacterium]|jgi:rfaE bifunctional protein kinase chain/domain
MNTTLINAIHQFKTKHIAVVGDVMIDHYINGKVDRISPEAPVPVVNVNSFDDRAGGAANVALNITSLKAKCSLFSVIGNDIHGKKLVSVCKKNKIKTDGLITSTSRITTLKARIIGNNHQLLRFDYETTVDITEQEEKRIIESFKKAAKTEKYDAVILEDYNKGVLTKNVIHQIIDYCNENEIPTLVDPKKNNFFEYRNCTLFKPNLKEIKESLHAIAIQPIKEDLTEASKQLQRKISNQISVITLADKGVFFHHQKNIGIVPAHLRNIADVSGAGDTVISVLALGLSSQLTLNETVEISNLAGGLVCESPGVVSITADKLLAELSKK